MALLKEEELKKVAMEISTHAQEFIERDGQLTREVITDLAYRYASHSISSERSCRIVDEYICNGFA